MGRCGTCRRSLLRGVCPFAQCPGDWAPGLPALQLVFDLEAALADVADMRELDRDRGRTPSLELVRARMRAVLLAAREPDEPYALRQALVDLAAVSTELAATLPRPSTALRRVA